MLAKLFADVHYCGLERINSNPTLIPSLDPEFLKILNSGPEAALLCRKLRLTGVPRIKKEGMPRKGTDHSCHNRADCNTVDEHNSDYKLSGITQLKALTYIAALYAIPQWVSAALILTCLVAMFVRSSYRSVEKIVLLEPYERAAPDQ